MLIWRPNFSTNSGDEKLGKDGRPAKENRKTQNHEVDSLIESMKLHFALTALRIFLSAKACLNVANSFIFPCLENISPSDKAETL